MEISGIFIILFPENPGCSINIIRETEDIRGLLGSLTLNSWVDRRCLQWIELFRDWKVSFCKLEWVFPSPTEKRRRLSPDWFIMFSFLCRKLIFHPRWRFNEQWTIIQFQVSVRRFTPRNYYFLWNKSFVFECQL